MVDTMLMPIEYHVNISNNVPETAVLRYAQPWKH